MYKLLLVEDDAALRYIYSKMKVWEKYNFKIVAEASNGKKALELLEKQEFDMMLTDIRMPLVDGLTLLHKIKEDNIDLLSILVSSYDEFEYAREGILVGAFDFIVKPVNEEKLAKALERAATHLTNKYSKSNIKKMLETVAIRYQLDIKENSFMQNVWSYLEKHITHKVTMEEIALEMNLSKDYFGKYFKKQTGMSFNAFYSIVRMEYAKSLIDSGKYKTYEISDQLGYSDPDYFTRVFKEITKMTPTQYKNRKIV